MGAGQSQLLQEMEKSSNCERHLLSLVRMSDATFTTFRR